MEWPEELTEAGRYEARFIGNDIDSEFDDSERAGHFCKYPAEFTSLYGPCLTVPLPHFRLCS